MAEPTTDFDSFFGEVFKNGGELFQRPFAYQKRLAIEAVLPSLINVPTGAGKTKAILGAWLWRRLQNPVSVGRRLIYCLPMRTLVEQTRDVAEAAVNRLIELGMIEKDRIGVHVLMGGDVSDKWDSWPERECILIGTQDMLLSRALNRGYAMSRFRWPVHFGLLNNDCLWVFDEVQLMGDGLATTAQLAAFRKRFQTFGHAHSIWMSATLERNWLRQIDFAQEVDQLAQLELSDADLEAEPLAKRLNALKRLGRADERCRLPQGLAEFVREKHRPGTQTLIVVNTVPRARELYDALSLLYGNVEVRGKKKNAAMEAENSAPIPEIELIHSRFRPAERARWKTLFSGQIDSGSAGRILVATQVIEAGVDISSRLLITDLAPFSSLVQRFGRCNRGGEFAESEIYWVDRPLTEKTAKFADVEQVESADQEKIAKPYEWGDLEVAGRLLEGLSSASPRALGQVDHRAAHQPAHVLRRRDLVDLFDTTPDLSGFDLDVSRFVRGGEERDLSVAWRELKGERPTAAEPRPMRDELCPVPIHEIKEFLKAKGSDASIWDGLEGAWRKITPDELRPGLTILLDAQAGGYDPQRGWDLKSKELVSMVDCPKESEEAYDDDHLTWLKYDQTLAAHSFEARTAAERILADLAMKDLEPYREELLFAVQHHDWGKAHPVFQATLHGLSSEGEGKIERLEPQLAKSSSGHRHSRKRFRHELASALALLQTNASDLTIYLAACHHGKVRLSIRALPDEVKPPGENPRFARGIWQGDELPGTDLGGGIHCDGLTLNLEPMLLGRGENGLPSWLERMLVVRDRLGVFRLAYLECLIRAADVQASSKPIDTWTRPNSMEERS